MKENTRLLTPLFLLIITLLTTNILQVTYGQEQDNVSETDTTDTTDITPLSKLQDSSEMVPEEDTGNNENMPQTEVISKTSSVFIDNISPESPLVSDNVVVKGHTENPPQGTAIAISWGDNSGRDITYPESDGTWQTETGHAYKGDGDYTISAYFKSCNAVNSCNEDEKTVTVTPSTSDHVLQPSITIDNIDPDEPVVDNAVYVDGIIKNPPSNSFTIDWGDDDQDVLSVPGTNSGGDKWTAQHTYEKSGSYAIEASLDDCRDSDQGSVQSCSVKKGVNVIDESKSSISIDEIDPDSPLTNDKLSIIGSTRHAPSNHINIDWGDNTGLSDIGLRENGNWFAEHSYSTKGEHIITASLDGCPSFLECRDTKNIMISEISNSGKFPSDPIYTVVPHNFTPFPISILLILILIVVSITGIVIAHKLRKRGQNKESGYQPTVEVKTEGGIEE